MEYEEIKALMFERMQQIKKIYNSCCGVLRWKLSFMTIVPSDCKDHFMAVYDSRHDQKSYLEGLKKSNTYKLIVVMDYTEERFNTIEESEFLKLA